MDLDGGEEEDHGFTGFSGARRSSPRMTVVVAEEERRRCKNSSSDDERWRRAPQGRREAT